MLDAQPKELSPGQVAVLESLLKAGFRFVTFERYGRYLGVERDGFVALLETGEGQVKLFGQVGYHGREGRNQKAEGRKQKAETCMQSRKGHESYTIASLEQFSAAAFLIRLAFHYHARRRRRSALASSLVDSP